MFLVCLMVESNSNYAHTFRTSKIISTTNITSDYRQLRNIARRDRKKFPSSIIIFHIIDNANWGEVDGSGISGKFDNCFESEPSGRGVSLVATTTCEMITSDTHLKNDLLISSMSEKFQKRLNVHILNDSSAVREKDSFIYSTANDPLILTVGLYHIHTWVTVSKAPQHKPDKVLLPTYYTMAESEESSSRFKVLFERSFKWYDGYSTTHPSSTVPRYYFRGWNQSEFLLSPPFAGLIRGGSFVASTCHRGEWQSKRQRYVHELRQVVRVDGLGRCMHTPNIPEGIVLPPKTPGQGVSEQEHLMVKRKTIARYMFYLAFENTNEPGYVTEKVFDALLAGIVPIYLGASEDCRKLIPNPKAVIFVDDFDHDMNKLGQYLTLLMANETAYEEHRAWRNDFVQQFTQENTFIPIGVSKKTWPCRICEWARNKYMQE